MALRPSKLGEYIDAVLEERARALTFLADGIDAEISEEAGEGVRGRRLGHAAVPPART